jgi:hypothetical protein
MRLWAPVSQRTQRSGWLFVLGSVLLLTGGINRESSGSPPESPLAKSASPAAAPKPSQAPQPSAAALVQKVYDGFGWIDAARSFRIRAEYSYTPMAEYLRWQAQHEGRGFGGGPAEPEPRTFCVDWDWAWDEHRLRHAYENHHVGDPKSTHGRNIRIWDGAMAISLSERADHFGPSYALDNKLSVLFNEQGITPRLLLPWGPGGAHHFWWLPTDVAASRSASGVLPEDFKLVGEETINGKACYLVESWIGEYRFAIGQADGRLYRRTWLLPDGKAPDDQQAIFQKVAGPKVKNYQQYMKWYHALDPAQRSRVARQWRAAEAEFVRKKTVAFQQFFDDYREVAPGHWLPFTQRVIQYHREASDSFVESHLEQRVTQVVVDQPLPTEPFRIELQEGVPVTADWRYDPPIHYKYSKNQPEADRIALQNQERKTQGTPDR